MTRCAEGRDDGFASVQWSVGFALGIVVLLLAANVVAIHYTAGALQAAAAAGARSGALLDGTVEGCEERAADVLRGEFGLLRGPYASGAAVVCRDLGERVEAVGSVTLAWWLDGLPSVTIRTRADAAVESSVTVPLEGSQPSNGFWPSG